jgi:alginate O-acetyltransferase complex protein AlgI
MLFQEPFFALFLFPAFYALYLAVNQRVSAKKWTLIVGSIAFYTWGEPLFVPVVLASALLDYLLTLGMNASKSASARRALLTIGVLANLGVLVFYKYADFLIANLNVLVSPFAGASIPLLKIALPIGVSFVVFEKITYLVDCHEGTTKPARTFSDYCLFVFMFPKLLAGPILKYHEMERQIAAPEPVQRRDFEEGFARFARGMAKKVLIADPLGTYADRVFSADATALGAGPAWLGLICFGLQIYFDFSGYSDMAIGLARMLGFRLKENFNMPYIARSLTDFWRRWHISLTSWIRDYLYIPLGGNRRGELHTYLNLWICFLASGFWHGASWNFVLWGAYNGLFLTLDRLFLLRWLERAGALVATIVTLLIVFFGWAIFRTTSVGQLADFTAALAGRAAGAPPELPVDVPLTCAVAILLCLFPATPLYAPLKRAFDENVILQKLRGLGLIALYVVASSRAFGVPFQPFIYFRF